MGLTEETLMSNDGVAQSASKSKLTQGPWTRIRPLQRDEMDPYTEAGMVTGELTWGRFRNNLCRVMAHCPRLMQTEVEYCNSFIFDPPTFRGAVQEAGFNDRFLKELVISKTSLINRSRYSVTHHSFIGMSVFGGGGRADEGHQKLLHLHEHDKHPGVYSDLERVVLDYTAKVTEDAHLVMDADFAALRRALLEDSRADARMAALPDDRIDAHVDSRIVELTWLISHFCLLNRWFTVLQVPDEGPLDEDNFLAAYEAVVPADIRDRNERVLQGGF
jgi:alkylhydroperoxidase family enzyme